jgi:hypothetical protein
MPSPRPLPYNNPRQNHEVVQTAATVDAQRRRRVAELAQREASDRAPDTRGFRVLGWEREAGTLGSGYKNG